MLIAVASTFGLQEVIRDKVSTFNGHIKISNYDRNNSQVSITPMDRSAAASIDTLANVAHIQAVATKAGIVRTETDFEGFILKGIGDDYDPTAFATYVSEGRMPRVDGNRENTELLVSRYLANRLNFKLGDKVIAYFLRDDTRANTRRFDIVGIYDSGFQEFDATYAIADIRHIQRMNKWDASQVGNLEVFVHDYDDIEETGLQVYDNVDTFLESQTVAEQFPSIFQWLELFDLNMLAILFIMVLVGGINMITALLVLILDRSQMIGILRALGSSNWQIRRIFLINASLLVGKGLFIGNAIGLGLLAIQYYTGVFSLDPETYYVTQAPVRFHWGWILGINLGTIALCYLMMLVPSMIISRIDITKTLKFE